jgi:hypothetical protein
MQISLAVSPYVATVGIVENVVLSLLGMVPAEHIRLPVPAPTTPGNELDFMLEEVDAQMMLDVGFSGAVTFQSNMKANAFYWISDLANSQVVNNTDDQSIIVDATYSVGMRLGIFATNLSASMNVNAYTIASKGSLNLASTAYQVLVLGAGLEAITALKPLIANSTAPFTVETIQVIGAVQSEMDSYLTDDKNQGKLSPILSRVTIDTDRLSEFSTGNYSPDLMQPSKAFIFALERAYRSKTADSAAHDASAHGVDATLVQQAYLEIFGLSGSDPVTPQALNTANSILPAGRI